MLAVARVAAGAVMGGAAIAAIRMSGPIMAVMITTLTAHGYHRVRDCSEMEQLFFIASAKRLC